MVRIIAWWKRLMLIRKRQTLINWLGLKISKGFPILEGILLNKWVGILAVLFVTVLEWFQSFIQFSLIGIYPLNPGKNLFGIHFYSKIRVSCYNHVITIENRVHFAFSEAVFSKHFRKNLLDGLESFTIFSASW